DRNTAAIQLPAPDWTHQPKIPGRITSAIGVHSTGPGPNRRELRVEGASGGQTGYWHKTLDADHWTFTGTGSDPLGHRVENPAEDRSKDTLAPPAPWNLSAPLPSRDAAIDGAMLADMGLPYGVVDPRLLDDIGQDAPPSGYVFDIE